MTSSTPQAPFPVHIFHPAKHSPQSQQDPKTIHPPAPSIHICSRTTTQSYHKPLTPITMSPSNPSFHTLKSTLLQTTPSLTRPPSHPFNPPLTPLIASLQLHPTLEATLHLLNGDLPSAHFLARHMSSPPAVEGMLLHAIVHRTEGDYANARAWAGDVADAVGGWVPKRVGRERLDEGAKTGMKGVDAGEDVLGFVYGEGGGIEELISEVENGRRKGWGKEREVDGEEEEVRWRIRRELERLLEWCGRKFGEGAWVDASGAWVRPGEEVRGIGEEMVSGGKGWREF